MAKRIKPQMTVTKVPAGEETRRAAFLALAKLLLIRYTTRD